MTDESNEDRLDSILFAVFLLGLALLSFLTGTVVAEFQLFPYDSLLEPPFRAMRAQLQQSRQLESRRASPRWNEARTDAKGVTTYKKEAAFEGFTVYQTHESAAYLIDMKGNRVYEWRKPFREVWTDPPHVDDPVPEDSIHWSGTHVFPNGDIIAHYTASGDTPYGYGLVKLDKNSNLIWKFAGHVHHDFSINEDGSLWVLTHKFRFLRARPTIPPSFREKWILEDSVVKLSPEGKQIRRIPLTDPVLESSIGSRFEQWHNGAPWDFLHANNVEPVPAKFARHHPFADTGDLLLSFREIDTIALLDPEDEKITWFAHGRWLKQQDPDPLPNGNLLIFDNLGHTGPGGRSRIVEFDPSAEKFVWSYTGTTSAEFATKWGGKQTVLPNGNILITENLSGRLFEIDRNGEIVWEFYVPDRIVEQGVEYLPSLSGRHQRIPYADLNFLD